MTHAGFASLAFIKSLLLEVLEGNYFAAALKL